MLERLVCETETVCGIVVDAGGGGGGAGGRLSQSQTNDGVKTREREERGFADSLVAPPRLDGVFSDPASGWVDEGKEDDDDGDGVAC